MIKKERWTCWLQINTLAALILFVALISIGIQGSAQVITSKKLDPNEASPENIQILLLKKVDTILLVELLPRYKNLRELQVLTSGISEFPEVICQLKELRILDLGNNNIRQLPNCICDLEHLEKIMLWDNNIFQLPDCLNEIKSLKEVDLYGMEYNFKEQDDFKFRFPNLKLILSLPCNCHFE